MMRKTSMAVVLVVAMVAGLVGNAGALSRERWTNPQPYGLFFNDYGPNVYVGFVPREQDRKRITIHVARGNQLRLRVVLSEAAIESYILDQVARHDLYKELIDMQVIQLTANSAWEAYDKSFVAAGLADSCRSGSTTCRRTSTGCSTTSRPA